MDITQRTHEKISHVREQLDRDIFSASTFSRQATLVVWSVGAAALATGLATAANLEGAKLPISSAYLVPFLGCSVVCLLASFLLSVARDLARVRTIYLKAYLLHLPLLEELRKKSAESLQHMLNIPDLVRAAAQFERVNAKAQMDRLSEDLERLRRESDSRAAPHHVSDKFTILNLRDADVEAISLLEAELNSASLKYAEELSRSIDRSVDMSGLTPLKAQFDLATACMNDLSRPFLDFLRVRRISILIECLLPTILALIAIIFVVNSGFSSVVH